MKKVSSHAFLLIFAATLCVAAPIAPPDPAQTSVGKPASEGAVNKTADGLAVRGYDVVAYFDQKQAMKGSADYTSAYQGAIYRFVSAEHRDAFAKDPEKFIPQYGGFCAYGTSQGHKAPADPETWTVIDGKLYLNYNKKVQKAFLQNSSGKLGQADANWQKLNK